MIIVVVMGIAMIYGFIYLGVALFQGVTRRYEDTNGDTNAFGIAMIILDFLIFIFCVAAGGSAGFLASILICVVVDMMIADGISKTSSPEAIARENRKTAMEDKDHNENGFIDWSSKD